jgi:death-on-curing family protein
MKNLTISEVEYMAFSLAQKLLHFNEPIPDFSTRFPNILESCLAVPFQFFSGKSLYRTFIAKSCILFYLMIKNHPFQNGNKRIAMTTLLFFLYKNKKWIRVDTKEFYNFTMWIAESSPRYKDECLSSIEKFLRTNLIHL